MCRDPEPPADVARTGVGPLAFALLAASLGVAAGLGAIAFRALIALVHNALFLGRISVHYDALLHTGPSPWSHAIVLAPVVGAIAVVFLVTRFAPEARGTGVPEVIDAVYYGDGVIRPAVAAVKSLASAITIGSGGSVGREGPIVQISAAFASWLGGAARVSPWQRTTLLAAGGAAGIGATFDTPLGGVLFAVEILLRELSVRTLVPVALATATATYVGERLLGSAPSFPIVSVRAPIAAATLAALAVLGSLMGVAAVAFVRSVYAAEDVFEKRLRHHPYLRHAGGMLVVGIIIDGMMILRGHYYVEGLGYATIADVLQGELATLWMLVVLATLKLLTTSLTLGSGGSGGVFSPSLFMGATLGGAFGILLRAFFPSMAFDVSTFALAGMAGLVAAATGGALTAIAMIFEMTRSHAIVLPLLVTVAVSHGMRRLLLPTSIYTMKLARRGHHVPDALCAAKQG